ncbi:hypothetical protein ABIE63_003392 [Limibacillus sp. MBR-115]|jgi:hypothetical protein|uniref:hypothetical protein n=2 Tax=Alphaproteobacteria TaxID=28211 RepID=UPI00261B49C9|nr:hypothetical protein [uncultured Roseovarius sp.]
MFVTMKVIPLAIALLAATSVAFAAGPSDDAGKTPSQLSHMQENGMMGDEKMGDGMSGMMDMMKMMQQMGPMMERCNEMMAAMADHMDSTPKAFGTPDDKS